MHRRQHSQTAYGTQYYYWIVKACDVCYQHAQRCQAYPKKYMATSFLEAPKFCLYCHGSVMFYISGTELRKAKPIRLFTVTNRLTCLPLKLHFPTPIRFKTRIKRASFHIFPKPLSKTVRIQAYFLQNQWYPLVAMTNLSWFLHVRYLRWNFEICYLLLFWVGLRFDLSRNFASVYDSNIKNKLQKIRWLIISHLNQGDTYGLGR